MKISSLQPSLPSHWKQCWRGREERKSWDWWRLFGFWSGISPSSLLSLQEGPDSKSRTQKVKKKKTEWGQRYGRKGISSTSSRPPGAKLFFFPECSRSSWGLSCPHTSGGVNEVSSRLLRHTDSHSKARASCDGWSLAGTLLNPIASGLPAVEESSSLWEISMLRSVYGEKFLAWHQSFVNFSFLIWDK